MKVILLKDVASLGAKDEVKNVNDGYARNYLLPRKLAVPATASALKEVETRKTQAAQKLQNETEKAKKIMKDLAKVKLTIKAKADEKGDLYGSVGAPQVAEALKAKRFEIAEDLIVIDEPIKKVGDYKIKVSFGPELVAEIPVKVAAEK